MKNKNNQNNKLLSEKDIKKSALTWTFFHHSAQNYERMMGIAFGHTMLEPMRKLYKDDEEEYKKSLIRHTQFFNTEPVLGSIIPGIVLGLEEGRAEDKEKVPEDLIIGVKNSMMGPLAGLGDSLVAATYQSIIASIAIGLAVSGSFFGPLFLLIFYSAVTFALKYGLFKKGYELGLGAIEKINSNISGLLTQALSIVGLITIGGITANTVKVPIAYEYVSGDLVINIQEQLDAIMPGILPLLLTIGIWQLYRKKNLTAPKAIILMIVIVLILVLLGIM